MFPGFKESLNSPMTPYNPNKKPDQGILKSPASIGSSSSGPSLSASSMATPPTPKSAHAIQKVKNKRQASTPVMFLQTAKKPTPMRKRAKAADFFLWWINCIFDSWIHVVYGLWMNEFATLERCTECLYLRFLFY